MLQAPSIDTNVVQEVQVSTPRASLTAHVTITLCCFFSFPNPLPTFYELGTEWVGIRYAYRSINGALTFP